MHSPPPQSRLAAPIWWQIGLSLLLLYAFYLCLKMFMLSGLLSRPHQAYSRDTSPTFRAQKFNPPATASTPRLPIPLYPGARDPQTAHMLINERNFFRCDFDVYAPAETVLNYYRRWFHGQGWTDETEKMLSPNALALGQVADVPFDPRNEDYLRFFDQMMRTQAHFSKDRRFVIISTSPQPKTHSTRIGLQYTEHGSPQDFAEMMTRSLGIGKGTPADPRGLRFSQTTEGRRGDTTFLQSRKSPDDYYHDLLTHYRSKGWRSYDAPVPGAPLTSRQTVLTRGPETGLLFVSPKEEGGGSKAMFTVTRR